MKIDILQWQEFNFNKIFLVKRGNRLKKSDQIFGDIAYISSTKTNNGIDNYVIPPEGGTIFNNAMTLNNSGSIGYCFYHSYDFIASDHCTILDIKDENIKLNITLFLFLKPIIETMKQKYGFAREMSNSRLNKEKILLPVKDNLPDWEYMKKYIQNKAKDTIYNKPVTYPKNRISLDSVEWQEFKISDLFILEKGERLTEADRVVGNTPLITASSYNNGITSFIDKNIFNSRKSLLVNKITIDMFANVFYHKYQYFSDDNIHTLIFDSELNIELNECICLFLMTILKKISIKYGFGRQVRLHRLNNEIISLPIDKNNQPNWRFMEDYIKSLPYSKSL
jgi:ribosomal protein L30E